ncbi:cytochrome P450 [Mycena albidolilacea]|uniref:Cytochrome P450 n=1 Tax=Mycena albidolilacea TaxID=1033008 RepID=A0AAD6ZYW8_9AGAR|nr:cytochrome P450 [Mycena albidolilacea]
MFELLLSLSAIVFLAFFWRRVSNRIRDDVALVPGPERDSLLTGNMHTLAASSSDAAAMAWDQVYGGVVKLHGVLGVSRHVLLISDPAALRRIFGSSSGQWDLSSRNLASFRSLFGPGIAAVEGADHLRQRRVVAQALTPVQIRGMIDFVQAASRNMRYALQKACVGPPIQLDMLDWARRVALDSLTMFAFGVSLHAVDEPEKIQDLLHTFDAMLEDCLGKTTRLKYFFRETAVAGIHPSLLGIALADPKFFVSMIRSSRRLSQFGEWVLKTREERGSLSSENNLLSLLERASKEDTKYKLADDEIRAQIGMVLFAGHDTVSTTFSLFLNDMGIYPDIQQRLRSEIEAKRVEIGGEDAIFTQEDYDSMPYLNAVLKESMRLNPVLGQTFRTNRVADVLPLSEPLLGLDGKFHNQLSVSKDTVVVINIASSNRRKDVWGDDAELFNPERWLKTEDKTVPLEKTPGIVYGSILNFLAGNRTCPGWRIAVLELQTFIVDVVEGFRILPVPGDVVVREFHGVSIPKVTGRPVRGGEVPLMLEALNI